MRVNFEASYRDIQRLFRATPQGDQAGDEFNKTLSNVSPDKAQVVGNKQGLPVEEIKFIEPPEAEVSARAGMRYDWPDLSMSEPLVEAAVKPAVKAPPTVVNEPSNSVKTPASVSSLMSAPVNPALIKQSHNNKVEHIKELVQKSGFKHGIDPALTLAVIKSESGFNPQAVSSDGHFSKGLMQLLDSTAEDQMARNGSESETYRPYNSETNIDLGVGYLRYLHDIFSQGKELPNSLTTVPAENFSSLEKLAVAAYNAGEGRVAAAQKHAKEDGKNPANFEAVESYLPDITRDYVQRVFQAKTGYEEWFIGRG